MATVLQGHQDRLLRGPMWSGCKPLEMFTPETAKVNIAAVSSKLVNERLAIKSDISTSTDIQVNAISNSARVLILVIEYLEN